MALKLTGKHFNKDNVVKNLVLNHKLVTHLDKAIAQFDEQWEFKYEAKEIDDAWHPSGDCTPSLHELYHKAQHPEDPREFGPSLRKTFMVGHFWHQYLQHIIVHKLEFAQPGHIERRGWRGWGEEYGPNRGRQLPSGVITNWEPYHWATGSADVAPCAVPGWGTGIVDFKTMKSIDFKRPYVPAYAADKWECQVNIYMDWFDEERALIVGIQKDSPHEMKEFEYHRNQPLIDAIYEKWEIVSECLDEGVEPPASEEHPLPLAGVVAK